MIPDPFINQDPLWQPFTLSPGSAEFAMPDTTASGLRAYLRSDEVTKALNKLQSPTRVHRERQPSLANIPTFPR
jgi:hypothetical protein